MSENIICPNCGAENEPSPLTELFRKMNSSRIQASLRTQCPHCDHNGVTFVHGNDALRHALDDSPDIIVVDDWDNL